MARGTRTQRNAAPPMSAGLQNTLAFIKDDGSVTFDDLRQIAEACRVRYDLLQRDFARAFQIGEEVTFTDPKTGQKHNGTVERPNRRTVRVATVSGPWVVAPELCYPTR